MSRLCILVDNQVKKLMRRKHLPVTGCQKDSWAAGGLRRPHLDPKLHCALFRARCKFPLNYYKPKTALCQKDFACWQWPVTPQPQGRLRSLLWQAQRRAQQGYRSLYHRFSWTSRRVRMSAMAASMAALSGLESNSSSSVILWHWLQMVSVCVDARRRAGWVPKLAPEPCKEKKFQSWTKIHNTKIYSIYTVDILDTKSQLRDYTGNISCID